MTTHQQADPETMQLLEAVAREYHPVLVEIGVTVGVLFAFGDVDAEGNIKPALKQHGIPCAAKIRLVSTRDRVMGMPDAQMLIDGDRWPLRSVKERRALLDHELQHLEPRFDDDGKAVLDDHGRPKLKIRVHDFDLAGFDDVIARHGEHAVEYQQVKALFDTRGQALFPFLQPEVANAE